MNAQLIEPESIELCPAIISAAFQLEMIIDKYRNVLIKDTFVAGSLTELANNLRKASIGDKNALNELIEGGVAILDIASQLAKHDGLQEQTGDYEYITAIKDADRYAVDSLELHSRLRYFKTEYFQKIFVTEENEYFELTEHIAT